MPQIITDAVCTARMDRLTLLHAVTIAFLVYVTYKLGW